MRKTGSKNSVLDMRKVGSAMGRLQSRITELEAELKEARGELVRVASALDDPLVRPDGTDANEWRLHVYSVNVERDRLRALIAAAPTEGQEVTK